MTRQRPRRIEHLHQTLERKLRMRIGRQVPAAHPADQLAEVRVARRVGAQHQRVDEEPDQFVQRRVHPPGDRAAQRNVGPGAKPRQQARKPRLQHHEQARARRPRQGGEPAMQFGVDGQRDMPAAMARHRRTRPVGRELDLLRKLTQSLLPERKLPRDRTVGFALLAQNRLLPQRVVGVLHRQCRKLRRRSFDARPVQHAQVPQQRTQRPAVARNVMQNQQQHVLGCHLAGRGFNRIEMRPQRKLPRKVEPAAHGSRKRRRKLIFGDVCDFEFDPRRGRRNHLLPRHAQHLREHRAQALVTFDQVAQRALQRRTVQFAGQPNRQRDRVGAARMRACRGLRPLARLQPLQEPQPPLRIGQRHLGGTRTRGERAPHRPRLRRQPLRQLAHARRLEQAADRQLHAQARTNPADQPRRQQ